MSLPILDIGRSVFESQYIGSTTLAALLLVVIFMIFMLFMDMQKDAVLLIPLPVFIAVGELAESQWLSVVAYIIAGVYFANIVLSIVNRDR